VSSSDGIGKLRAIERQFDRDRISVADLKSLEDIRTRYLSRKAGLLTLELQSLGKLPKDQRAEFGRVANEVKLRIEAALDTLQATIADREKQTALGREALDVTLPGNRRRAGHRHPLTIIRNEIEDIFVSMGYTVEDGPEVENTYYNFDALNFPAGHPARDPRDTFYVSEHMILRTHTSPVQVRTMEKIQPPVRIICPGRVFRRDAFDPTHSPMFQDGPEVENTYYNFDALNFPAGHPARDPRDTFYVSEHMILRTHTSPVQVRTMEKIQPPVRIICPGRVFRRDAFDPTHSPMF